MSVEIKTPVFPEAVADGVIVTWHKKKGDLVLQDEVLVDIETDKVMFEVPSPINGILEDIFVPEGEVVVSAQLLARVSETAVVAANDSPENSEPEKKDMAAPVINVAPAAKKMINELGLSELDITGSGKAGRILKEDVMAFVEADRHSQTASGAAGVVPPAVAVETENAVEHAVGNAATNPSVYYFPDQQRDKRVPMTRLRKMIATRLVDVQNTAAILTTFNEVNMQAVMDIRTQHKDDFAKKHGVKLGFMSFFVKAVTEALKQFPVVNASVDGDDIVYHNFFDVGIAVSSERGLIVPILRDVDQMGLADIEGGIAAFAEKARSGTLGIEDITGGTFTITNGGVFGSMLSTPILNPPQSAILGMHNIKMRAVVEEGEIVARPMMYLALSYDHRIIDGQEAVRFLVTIKDQLEDPARMLLEI